MFPLPRHGSDKILPPRFLARSRARALPEHGAAWKHSHPPEVERIRRIALKKERHTNVSIAPKRRFLFFSYFFGLRALRLD
jgi:hypothetical protein